LSAFNIQKLLRAALAVCMATLFSSTLFAAALSNAEVQRIDAAAAKQLQRSLRETGAGVGYALIDEGKVVLLKAGGLANADDPKRPAFGIDTASPVGSVTRLITAILALKLEKSGKLALNQSLISMLPELQFAGPNAPTAGAIQIQNLLNNSSGISRGRIRDLYIPAASNLSAAKAPPAEPHWLTRPAGQFSELSFQSDAILGAVLERAGKASLQELLMQEIATPLNLKSPHFDALATDAAEHNDDGTAFPARISRLPAALGLKISLRDLAILLSQLDPQKAAKGGFASEFAALLATPHSQGLKFDFSEANNGQGYAFGFTQSSRKAVGMVGYLDSTLTGHDVAIRRFSQHGLTAIVMSNASTKSDELRDLINILSDTALLEKSGIAKRDKQALQPPPATLAMPAGLIPDDIQPAYATPGGLIVPSSSEAEFDFELAGFGLRAIRRADGWYRLRYRLLGFIPLNLSFIENVLIAPVRPSAKSTSGAGAHYLLYAAGSEVGLFGSAIAADSISGDAGESWLGEYDLANPDAFSNAVAVSNLSIARQSGVLVLRARFDRFINVNFSLPISVLNPKLALISGFGPGLGEPISRSQSDTLSFGGYLLSKSAE
jgi:CubicO group peptidase (beta-lactamase class C family)